ncbi:MAG: proteasome accessory factor PafA2 family protein [Candidatus Yanofskybacteria bacterium]|nr:proteasome accessory factor PafA2 family protein [Candidatus Yanofskybacteria bacterium]
MKPLTSFACELDRIYGTETEYGLYWNTNKTDIFDLMDRNFALSITDYENLFNCFDNLNFSRLSEFFVQNGGLIKKDNPNDYCDCTPEFATPECKSARDAVCWEKAGEIIMRGLFDLSGANNSVFLMVKHGRGMANYWGLDGTVVEVSCGHHENYSYDEELKARLKKDSWESCVFVSFLASRILFSGAGWLDSKGLGYKLSQRVDFLEQIKGLSTTEKRALICTRDEPLGTLSPPRLHLIAGDHLMSEVALYLTLGSTGLVVRMLESGYDFAGVPILENPILALRIFNSDPLLKNKAMLSGLQKEITALEIQEYFCARAGEFINCNPSTEEENDIVAYWASVLKRLKKDIYSLYGELDWVTKLCLMESYLEKYGICPERIRETNGLPLETLNCCMSLDLTYHFITPDGLYNKLKEAGLIKRLLSDEEITHAVTNPPQDTRARIRGEMIQLMKSGKIEGRVGNWNSFSLSGLPPHQRLVRSVIGMEDPFDFYCKVWQDQKRSLGFS